MRARGRAGPRGGGGRGGRQVLLAGGQRVPAAVVALGMGTSLDFLGTVSASGVKAVLARGSRGGIPAFPFIIINLLAL